MVNGVKSGASGVSSLSKVNAPNGIGVLNSALGFNALGGVPTLRNGQANKVGIDGLQIGEVVAWR